VAGSGYPAGPSIRRSAAGLRARASHIGPGEDQSHPSRRVYPAALQTLSRDVCNHRPRIGFSSNLLETNTLIESQSGVINLDAQADLRNPLLTCLGEQSSQKQPADTPTSRFSSHSDRELGDLLRDKPIRVIVLRPEAMPGGSEGMRGVRHRQDSGVAVPTPPKEQLGEVRSPKADLEGRTRKRRTPERRFEQHLVEEGKIRDSRPSHLRGCHRRTVDSRGRFSPLASRLRGAARVRPRDRSIVRTRRGAPFDPQSFEESRKEDVR
jgi:hypothetical protein